MKMKMCLASALAASSLGAAAEWQLVGSNSQAGITVYVDSTSKFTNGSLVKMWNMSDYLRPNERGRKSEKVQYEYDCHAGNTRMLAFVSYSGNMGDGSTILSMNSPQEWKPVPPDTSIFERWKMACDKE
jgi:hypothetical protein